MNKTISKGLWIAIIIVNALYLGGTLLSNFIQSLLFFMHGYASFYETMYRFMNSLLLPLVPVAMLIMAINLRKRPAFAFPMMMLGIFFFLNSIANIVVNFMSQTQSGMDIGYYVVSYIPRFFAAIFALVFMIVHIFLCKSVHPFARRDEKAEPKKKASCESSLVA